MSFSSSILRRVAALAVPAAILLAGGVRAQTTGGIVGSVSGENTALPGVEVSATSPALQGARTAITDSSGVYRLSFLPPGTYRITFTLAGFAAEARDNVPVNLGRDTTIDVQLRAQASEELTVVAAAPVVDATSTTVGHNITLKQIETLPSGRNYSSVVQVTPGVSSDAHPENTDQASITVYGSTGAENVYYIDGVNTTNMEYGFQGKQLNFEFIDEIDVKTGGYEAEYGKATGGVVNVITKSGGNEFRGDVFAYRDDDSFQADPDPIVSPTGQVTGYTRQDYGLDLGGYIVRDRLWFFGAYDKVDNSVDRELINGDTVVAATSESDRDLGAAKLTWNLGNSQTVVGSYLQDPRDDSGAINDSQHTLNGDPSTYLGVQNYGGRDYALRYDGIYGGEWTASLQVARHDEENSVGPDTAAGAGIQFRDAQNDFYQTGGFGLVQEKEFQRDFFGGSVARFFGASEVKLGLEYETEEAEVSKVFSGGQQIDVFRNENDPSRPIYSHFYWTTPNATLANAPVSSLNAAPEHKITTAYLQTSWVATANLTVNAGVRWDRQQIIDASGVERIDLDKDFAPRLGVIWSPPTAAQDKVYFSYGRYYEQIPMDLVIRSFSFERQARIFNYSATSTTPDANAEADLGSESAIFGGFTEPVDPDLENQYLNEYLLGYERELRPDVAVGIKGIYRDYGQVIEDFLCADDGTYCIGNPGEGIMDRVFTLDYSTTYEAPEPDRVFKGVQLDVSKRLSNNWQALASYLYSKLDGNFDGLYAPFTNVGADPNITAAYDYYDFFTNGSDLSRVTNEGPLSNDRRHQFKISGTYYTPWKLELGAAAYYRTGTPVTRYGYSDIYGRYEFFLTERGAEGRTPDTYEMDVHVGYPITAGPVTINLLLDVFNLLNAQRAVLVDQRWGFQEADNASPTPVNPNYGDPVLRTPPTSFRLGARLSF